MQKMQLRQEVEIDMLTTRPERHVKAMLRQIHRFPSFLLADWLPLYTKDTWARLPSPYIEKTGALWSREVSGPEFAFGGLCCILHLYYYLCTTQPCGLHRSKRGFVAEHHGSIKTR